MPSPCTALILQLSGCLVDFGARTLPVALQRLYPEHTPPNLAATPQQTLDAWLGKPPTAAQRQALQQTLSEVAGDHAELTPGAAQLLQTLHATDTPCAWLDDLPADASLRLAEVLPTPIEAMISGDPSLSKSARSKRTSPKKLGNATMLLIIVVESGE